MPRRTGTIWEHFLIISESGGKKHVTCNYCNLQYKAAQATRLKEHVLKCNKCPVEVKKTYRPEKRNNFGSNTPVPVLSHASRSSTSTTTDSSSASTSNATTTNIIENTSSSSDLKPSTRKVFSLAEFQVDEEETFGAAARARNSNLSVQSNSLLAQTNNANNSTVTEQSSDRSRENRPLRIAASGPSPLAPSANPLLWPEEPLPKISPGKNADECQIFGDFVASELRTLRSVEARRKLKRIIQRAILKIEEEEDVHIING